MSINNNLEVFCLSMSYITIWGYLLILSESEINAYSLIALVKRIGVNFWPIQYINKSGAEGVFRSWFYVQSSRIFLDFHFKENISNNIFSLEHKCSNKILLNTITYWVTQNWLHICIVYHKPILAVQICGKFWDTQYHFTLRAFDAVFPFKTKDFFALLNFFSFHGKEC